MLKFWDYNR